MVKVRFRVKVWVRLYKRAIKSNQSRLIYVCLRRIEQKRCWQSFFVWQRKIKMHKCLLFNRYVICQIFKRLSVG